MTGVKTGSVLKCKIELKKQEDDSDVGSEFGSETSQQRNHEEMEDKNTLFFNYLEGFFVFLIKFNRGQ
jgi:hypothetical protein